MPRAAASMPSPRSHWAWGARRSTPAFCEPSHRRCWLQFGTGELPLRSWLAHRHHGGSVALRYTKPVRCCGWVGGAAWMGLAECACAADGHWLLRRQTWWLRTGIARVLFRVGRSPGIPALVHSSPGHCLHWPRPAKVGVGLGLALTWAMVWERSPG